MGVLGGFIHKVGLVRLGGASTKEVDAETTYMQPTEGHSSNHPVSSGWWSSVYGTQGFNASASTTHTSITAPVAGTCIGMGVDVSVNTRTMDQLIYFYASAYNLTLQYPAGNTGSLVDDDLNFPFVKGVSLALNQSASLGGGGSMDFKYSTIIKWD